MIYSEQQYTGTIPTAGEYNPPTGSILEFCQTLEQYQFARVTARSGVTRFLSSVIVPPATASLAFYDDNGSLGSVTIYPLPNNFPIHVGGTLCDVQYRYSVVNNGFVNESVGTERGKYRYGTYSYSNFVSYEMADGYVLSPSLEAILLEADLLYGNRFPITYRLTNATTTGPNEATVGDTVTVPLQFTTGYGIVNPATDVYVTSNGVAVPSQYSNGVLTFTMPDPS